MSRAIIVRALAWTLVVAALAFTLALNLFTLDQIPRAATRVPWQDGWSMIEEFSGLQHGAPLWPILWSSYWGHRLVIPRLIFFANMRWAADAPLTWLTLLVQFVHIAILVGIAWVLFKRRSLFYFAVAASIVLNLMLSPYQMENFTWNMQTMFTLVYASASAAFLFLALSATRNAVLFRSAAICAALIGSLTMPNGILIWPVLVAQAIYLRLNRRFTIVLAVVGTAIIVLYGWHYQRPDMGMGVGGMLRHPLDAIMLISFLLGSCLDTFSLEMRIAFGLIGSAVALYVVTRLLRRDLPERRWIAVLAAACLFLFLSAASTVAGRLGSEWLHRRDLNLPPRYFTLICAFWTTVGVLAVYAWSRRLQPLGVTVLWAAAFYVLMFLHPQHRLELAEDWADFFRGADAVGAALILDAPENQWLGYLIDSKPARDRDIRFMHDRRISVFAEQRATWPGKTMPEAFPAAREDRCDGALENADRLPGPGQESWRVEGWALDRDTMKIPGDLVITDSTGKITGLARGGLRHRYFPGFFVDTQSPRIFHDGQRRAEWLGYVRGGKPWSVYAVWPAARRMCRVANVP